MAHGGLTITLMIAVTASCVVAEPHHANPAQDLAPSVDPLRVAPPAEEASSGEPSPSAASAASVGAGLAAPNATAELGMGGGGRSWSCISLQGDVLPPACPNFELGVPCAAWDHIKVELSPQSTSGVDDPTPIVGDYARQIQGCFAESDPGERTLRIKIVGKPGGCPIDEPDVTLSGVLSDAKTRSCVRNVFRYRVLPEGDARRIQMLFDLTVRVTVR